LKSYESQDLGVYCFIFFVIWAQNIFAQTVIDAKVYRHQDGTGECLVSSGFPLPPGLVSEQMIRDGSVIVKVKGVEVAANITALRGRHYDESLRSMLIQFTYSMVQGESVPAQVVIGEGVRAYPDPLYRRPTFEIVQNNNVILPFDPEYLVSTMLTFRHLLPAGKANPPEEKLFTELAEDRFNALSINQAYGTADYENVSAILGLWCRLGDIKFFNEALKMTLNWIPYNTPMINNPERECRADAVANPDKRKVDHNHCGLPAEWHFPRNYSYAQMYLLTGYRDFWGIVAHIAQWGQIFIKTQDDAHDHVLCKCGYDYPRFNYARYGALIPALMIDATMPANGQWFNGRVFDWDEQIKWNINAIEKAKWDFKWIPFVNGEGIVPAYGTIVTQSPVSAKLLGVFNKKFDPGIVAGQLMPESGYLQVNEISGGAFDVGALGGIHASSAGPEESDYRQNMTGTRSWTPRAEPIPIFQLTFPSNFLIDYYLYVQRDARIPQMVKYNIDIILQNIRRMTLNDSYYNVNGGKWGNPTYGSPYSLENPVSSANASPYELPEYIRMLAFVLKTLGDDTVNGATYSDWYIRLINTGNVSPVNILIWQWKNFGQFYGWNQDTSWIMSEDSIITHAPSTLRIPTQYDSIPGETPDLYRITVSDLKNNELIQ
jgi:hypothetical protein